VLRLLVGELRSARQAELGDVRVLGTALRADRHATEFAAIRDPALTAPRKAVHGTFTDPEPNPPRKGTSATSHWTNTQGTPTPTAEGKGDEMSAAELEVLYVSEIDRIEQWRHEELGRAGYDPESALVLAASHDVDLHKAVGLLERGCSVELALQILL